MRLPRDVHMPDNGQLRFGIATLAALGSTISDAAQIVSQIAVVTGADATKGVALPSGLKGMKVRVINTNTSSILKVYPYNGDSSIINALSANASISISPDSSMEFECLSKTQWYTPGISSVTPGTAAAGKALVLDSNGKITSGLKSLTFDAGTASVAPIVLTAGTNLTTAAAGAIEFDGTAFYATAVASTRQQLDAEQWTIANTDSATYNNTGLDTASAAAVFTTTMGGSSTGAITLVAGKTYAFEAMYVLTNTGTTSHTWSVLFGGTATMTTITYMINSLSATQTAPAGSGLQGYSTVLTAVVATAASTSATENVTIMLNGIMVVNAGGTIIPQMQASARPGASGTPGVVVKKGSYFRIWEMGGNGTLGNWS